ncbi:MAG: hypothetical protein ABIO24_09110 [Saprospiraceae bacterium]
MKSLPKYSAERLRLMAHLERQKLLIHEDMHEIKASLKPIALAKQVISNAAESFRDNSMATQAARLALTVLPRAIRHPVLGIVAQIALPMVVRQVPRLAHFFQDKEQTKDVIANTKLKVLGGLRNSVSKLRRRLKKEE